MARLLLVLVLWTGFFLAPASAGAAVANWLRTFGGSGSQGWGAARDRNGDVYLVGQSGPDDDASGFLVKYDAAGALLWQTGVGGMGFRGVATDPFNNVYVTGYILKSQPGESLESDAFVAKFNSQGQTQWLIPVGGGAGNDLAANARGVFVCGANEGDAFVKGLGHNGGEVWSRTLASDEPDYALAITATTYKGVFVVGHTRGSLYGPNRGGSDPFVAQFSSAGPPLYKDQFGTALNDNAAAVDATRPEQVVIAGYTRGSLFGGNNGLSDPYVAAIWSHTLGIAWTGQYGGSTMEFPGGVHHDVTGATHLGVWSFSAGPQLYKLGETGQVQSVSNTTTSSRGTLRDMDGDGGGMVVVAGREGTGTTGHAYITQFYDSQLVLRNVPDYLWNYGCTPTSAGMLMGYWDLRGYDNLVEGTAPLTSAPQDQERPEARGPDDYRTGVDSDRVVDALIASQGHHRDYWAHGLNAGAGANVDPMLDGHANDSLADFIGTSRGDIPNGYSEVGSVAGGLRAWAQERGYSGLSAGPNDTRPSFIKLKEAIDAGCPVLLALSLDGRGGDGHSVLAYGYKDLGPDSRWFAVRDTWAPGNSDGHKAIEAFVDADGIEWWKWSDRRTTSNPLAYVAQINTFGSREGIRPMGTSESVSDSFSRLGAGGEVTGSLGYTVSDASADQSGQVEIAASPLDAGESVLQMTSLTGEAISISTEVEIDELAWLSFDYLFADPGKLEFFLDSTLLGDLLSPADGPGSPGSTEWGAYEGRFDLASLAFDPYGLYDFSLALSAPDDPTLYLDNLVLLTAPAPIQAIPEPSTLGLLLVSLAGLALRRRPVVGGRL